MNNLIILLILFGIVLFISIIVVLLVFVFFKNNDDDKSIDDYHHTNEINDVDVVEDITEVPVISKKRSRKKKPWYESKKFRTNKI